MAGSEKNQHYHNTKGGKPQGKESTVTKTTHNLDISKVKHRHRQEKTIDSVLAEGQWRARLESSEEDGRFWKISIVLGRKRKKRGRITVRILGVGES